MPTRSTFARLVGAALVLSSLTLVGPAPDGPDPVATIDKSNAFPGA